MISIYSLVMLVSDGYEAKGGYRGMLGYVIEVYGDGNYEVEFSDRGSGESIAQFAVNERDLENLENLPGQEEDLTM